MLPSSATGSQVGERRAAERHACAQQLTCRVINPLNECGTPAGLWNMSPGGVCLLVESHFIPRARLAIELEDRSAQSRRYLFAEVRYAILVPSFREIYLTGCAFQGETLPVEELQPPSRGQLGKIG